MIEGVVNDAYEAVVTSRSLYADALGFGSAIFRTSP